MIASVRGRVVAVNPSTAVVEVGGVGMQVQCVPDTLAELRLGAEVMLATSLVVREDSLTLFGFTDAEQRELFVLVQTVAGIGPRIALATLAVLEPDTLRRALLDGDLATLTRVPGIGRKGAERLVLELKDKVTAPDTAQAHLPVSASSGNPRRDEVVEALIGLGFPQRPAEQAVDGALAAGEHATSSTLLRTALSALGRR